LRLNNPTRKLLLTGLAAVLVTGVVAGLALGATTGIISGVVSDQAKGARLSGANIVVKGFNLTTVTDANGFYSITNVPPGTYEVSASMVGYKDAAKSDVQVVMDATANASFGMVEAVTAEKEATVTAVRPMTHPDQVPTLYTATSKQEQMLITDPGKLYQVTEVVSSQPGVVIDPTTNIPHIRGGRDSQTGYMLEGISVVDPNSNSFATNLVTIGLRTIQVYTGGFGAEYGNANGGVLNEVKKTGREAPGVTTEALFGTQQYRGIRAEVGEVTPSGLDYYIGGYLWSTDHERWSIAPPFPQVKRSQWEDFVGKFVYPTSDTDKVTLLVGQGSGKAGMDEPPAALPPAENGNSLNQGYTLAGLSWTRNFTPSSFLTIRPYILDSRSGTGQVFDVSVFVGPGALGGFAAESRTRQRGLQAYYTNQLSEKHLLKTGVSMVDADCRYEDTNSMFFDSELVFAETRVSDVKTRQLGAFVQDQIKVNDKTDLQIGLREDHIKYDKVSLFPDTSQSVLSPRVGLTYTPSPKNVWRASWGRFAMFSPTRITGMVTDLGDTLNGNDNPEKSQSFDLGYERQLSATTLMRITPFHMLYQDMLQKIPSDGFTPATYVNLGHGSTNGVEVYFQRRLAKNWEGWLAYTWMRARAEANASTDAPGGATDFVNWDQRHTLEAATSYNHGLWNHTLDLYYGSGLYNRTFQHRMGSNTIVNYGLTRKLSKKPGYGDSVRLSVSNIFNVGTPVQIDDIFGEPSAWVLPRFVNLSVTKTL
jgi:outer membrane cobalamin receptor